MHRQLLMYASHTDSARYTYIGLCAHITLPAAALTDAVPAVGEALRVAGAVSCGLDDRLEGPRDVPAILAST